MKFMCFECLIEEREENKNEVLTVWNGFLLCLEHIIPFQQKESNRLRQYYKKYKR